MSKSKASLKKTPQVAVIGAGQWGKNLVRVFGELGALRGVYDADPAKCRG